MGKICLHQGSICDLHCGAECGWAVVDKAIEGLRAAHPEIFVSPQKMERMRQEVAAVTRAAARK